MSDPLPDLDRDTKNKLAGFASIGLTDYWDAKEQPPVSTAVNEYLDRMVDRVDNDDI